MAYKKRLHYWMVSILSVIPMSLFFWFVFHTTGQSNAEFADLAAIVMIILFGPGALLGIPVLWFALHYVFAKLFGRNQTWTFYPKLFLTLFVIDVILWFAPYAVITFF